MPVIWRLSFLVRGDLVPTIPEALAPIDLALHRRIVAVVVFVARLLLRCPACGCFAAGLRGGGLFGQQWVVPLRAVRRLVPEVARLSFLLDEIPPVADALAPLFVVVLVVLVLVAVVSVVRGRNRRCLLYTSPSPRDATLSRMPSSA